MQMTKTAAAIALTTLLAYSHAHAGDDFLHEWTEQYRQRIEGVTTGGGDAKAVNAAAHVIDPWPRNAGDLRIPGNGARLVGAIERYKDVKKLREAAPTLAPESITPGGSGAATGQ
jgi:hypothetical protein